jgi:hypothetical protein
MWAMHTPLPELIKVALPVEIDITTLGDAYRTRTVLDMHVGIYRARRIPSTGHQCYDAVTGDAIYDWDGEGW